MAAAFIVLIIIGLIVGFSYLIVENRTLMNKNNKLTETLTAERSRQRKVVEDLEVIAKFEPLAALSALRKYLETLK